MSDLHDALEETLAAEPKPIGETRLLAIAQQVLPPREYDQFSKWAKKNGASLLKRLNG